MYNKNKKTLEMFSRTTIEVFGQSQTAVQTKMPIIKLINLFYQGILVQTV